MILFLFVMTVCVGMVIYGTVTFVVRLRRQRARRDLASQRIDPSDIAVMATAPPAATSQSE